MRWVELGLQEDAAIGYRLQRGWPFVGETKANEELEKQSGLLFCYFVKLTVIVMYVILIFSSFLVLSRKIYSPRLTPALTSLPLLAATPLSAHIS